MLHWFRDHRRQKILQAPFPDHWQEILVTRIKHYGFLSQDEKNILKQLIKLFIAEKYFKGCNDLEITDEIRLVISAEACILLLGLPYHLYEHLQTILVYPATVVLPPRPVSFFAQTPAIIDSEIAISGQAFKRGPVIIIWDTAKREARHPESGHNVVYHEFAHILDMSSGVTNGTPLLHSQEEYKVWAQVLSKEFLALRRAAKKGQRSFLDQYGSLNEAEFFAVATEFFFDKPQQMRAKHRALYDVLAGFYRQDTAAREHNYRQKKMMAS